MSRYDPNSPITSDDVYKAIQTLEDAMREHGRVFVELESLNENVTFWFRKGIAGQSALSGEENSVVASRELHDRVDDLRKAASDPLAALFVAHDMLMDMWRVMGQRERDAKDEAARGAAQS